MSDYSNIVEHRAGIKIRNLAPHEMYILDQMADLGGRNTGFTDGEFLYNADNNGFIAAMEGTEVTGTISLVSYENNLGFLGFHIVVPHYKNTGLFEKLLSVAIDGAGERNIGTNCSEEHLPLYESMGFKPAFKILTYEGIADGIYKDLPKYINSPFLVPLVKLYNYYRTVFPYERKLFTSFWINQPGSLLFGKYENNEYKGFGLFKPCRKGYCLSPLISDDSQTALELLTSLVSHFKAGTQFNLDIPETNKEGMRLANELKLKKIGEQIRMYKGYEHKIILDNTYSFTNQEIG